MDVIDKTTFERKKGNDPSVSAYINATFVIILSGKMVGDKHSRCIAALQLQDINFSLHCFEQRKHDIDMLKIEK